eukprot:1780950-Alexandrium_andersonii.AAC.1
MLLWSWQQLPDWLTQANVILQFRPWRTHHAERRHSTQGKNSRSSAALSSSPPSRPTALRCLTGT